MKLKIGKAVYKVPKYSEIIKVVIIFKRHRILLQHRPMDFNLPVASHRGIPTSFSDNGKDMIEFYPVPDKAYRAEVIFTPQVKKY